jgi:hypothetical protein
MKRVVSLLAVLASSVPSLALACPYSSACASCSSSSSFGEYGAWLVLGLGMGIASVAFERKRR